MEYYKAPKKKTQKNLLIDTTAQMNLIDNVLSKKKPDRKEHTV